jgi:hypothetical protein
MTAASPDSFDSDSPSKGCSQKSYLTPIPITDLYSPFKRARTVVRDRAAISCATNRRRSRKVSRRLE